MKQGARTYGKAVLNLIIAGVIAVFVIFLLPKVLVFFMPFVIGWIISLIASPLVRFFEVRLKIRRKAGTAFVIIAVIALVILCGYFIGVKVAEEATGFIHEFPAMWDSFEGDLREVGEKLDVLYMRLPVQLRDAIVSLGEQMDQFSASIVSNVGTPTIEAVGNFARHLPNFIINVIMCLLSAYFFVAEKEYMNTSVKNRLPKSILNRWDMMSRSLKRAVGGYFKAQFKIEICMYILLAVGLWILKVEYVLLIALIIAILDFLPFFGTGAVLIPWAIIKILSSDYKMAIGLLIIWAVGQLARQIIQPKIVGDSIGVPAIPTLFLLFIGYKVGGVIGMILGVPIGIILFNMDEEGVFDTTKNSIRILVSGMNHFRRLEPEDFVQAEEYEEWQRRRIQKKKEEQGEKK